MRKIWIIDDDETYSFICQTLLIRAGWSISSIVLWDSGRAALEHLKANAQNKSALPDVILLDLNMPYMDGWMFMDHFKPLILGRKVRVHIQSSSVSPTDQARAKGYSEIVGYIIKPLDLAGARKLRA